MDNSGRTKPGSTENSQSQDHSMPMDCCAEWLDRMKEWMESSAGVMGCCERTWSACCGEPETNEEV